MIRLILIFATISLVASKSFDITKRNQQQCCGTCFMFGCPTGQCCSQFGYCGATPDHCQGAVTQGNCQTKGCPDGLCCSKFGFCGNSPSHCDNSPVTNGNCKTQGCPSGQCCSRHGFCGTSPDHCGNLDPTAGQGNCQSTGCGAGLCCSRFGFCGRTPQHCSATGGGAESGSGCGGCSLGAPATSCPYVCGGR